MQPYVEPIELFSQFNVNNIWRVPNKIVQACTIYK